MMRPAAVLSGVLLAVLVAMPAAAGQVSLTLHDGHVTLHAKDASIQQVLAEWAKVGHTRFVNAGKVVGPPLTLQLSDVPESQALDLVLHSAAGYMAAPRTTYLPNASVYDRVLILATSRAPVVPTPHTGNARRPTTFYPPQFHRFIPPSALRFFRPPQRPQGSKGNSNPQDNGDNGSNDSGAVSPAAGSQVISAPVVVPQPGIIVKPKKTKKPSGGGR